MIPHWMLERYRLGELTADEKARVAAALEAEPALREKLAALEQDDAKLLSAHPPARVAASIRARAEARKAGPSPRSWLAPALALAAAAAVVGLVISRPPPDDDVIRFKGDGPSLRLFRLAGQGSERLTEGASVKPHDVVQVAFELEGARHLVVVSVDGAGQVTRHWPRGDDTRAPADLKRLPESFELDDAPGFERFFLVTSDAPLPVTELLSAAKQAGRDGALPVPPGAQVCSLLLDKVTR